jgi:hypothetical protein
VMAVWTGIHTTRAPAEFASHAVCCMEAIATFLTRHYPGALLQ